MVDSGVFSGDKEAEEQREMERARDRETGWRGSVAVVEVVGAGSMKQRARERSRGSRRRCGGGAMVVVRP